MGAKYTTRTYTCEHCGKEYRADHEVRRKFCCRACRKAARPQKVCANCGIRFDVPPSAEKYRNVTYCSMKCRGEATRGTNSPHWSGNSARYKGVEWRVQRSIARERDGYRCQVCGIHESQLSHALDVHHIIPRKEFEGDLESANALTNLICLCHSCHRKAETRKVPVQPRLV